MKTKLSWSWILKKRLLKINSPLFEEGNIFCSLASKKFTAFDDIEDIIQSTRKTEFPCGIGTCTKTFNSLAEYESHYNSVHKNVCSVCRRFYPTSHLLDIHLLEWHDTMFELLAEKQPMFQCLIPSCSTKLSSRKQRKDHMIKVHKYPSNFRFDREKKNLNKKNNKDTSDKNTIDGSPEDSMMEVTIESNKMEKSKIQYSYRVPENFSFGHGVSRGFQRKRGRGRGGRGCHWHNQDQVNMQVEIENVNMNELSEALDTS